MSGIRSTLSAQDLAFHDEMELLPQSAAILREDIEHGRIVINPQKCAASIAENTAENTSDILNSSICG